MHQLYCRKLINWCRNQVCTRTPRGEQTTHWRKERTKGPKGHTAVSASEVWIETLGLNTKAHVRRWSCRHHHNAIQSDVYVLYILFERITWERRMPTAWLEINHLWGFIWVLMSTWEALARKNSREMVQKLIEEAGISRGDKANPSKSPWECGFEMRPWDYMRLIFD